MKEKSGPPDELSAGAEGSASEVHVCKGCNGYPQDDTMVWESGSVAGVAFDMDGTIVATDEKVHSPSWKAGMMACLEGACIQCEKGSQGRIDCFRAEVDFVWGRAAGNAEPQCSEKMAELLNLKYGLKLSPQDLTNARMLYLENSSIEPERLPFIEEIMGWCDRHCLVTGIATNSRQCCANWVMKRSGLCRFKAYSNLICAEDVEQPGHFKPHPIPWAFLFMKMGIHNTGKRILVLEDSLTSALGALDAHPLVHVFLIASSDENSRLRLFDAHKVQPREWSDRIQIVRDWRPVLDVLRTVCPSES